jgi:hypothetical protein
MSQLAAMLVAGPVPQSTGIRNLYYGSAALLVLIAIIGLRQLRQPTPSEKPVAMDAVG